MGVAEAIAIVGVIVALAAILVAVRLRERRQLIYEISTDTRIVTVGKSVKDDIEIRYQGKEVEDLTGVTITISSTGNQAVRIPEKTQYETPPTIEFNEGVMLLGSPRITRTVPSDLTASTTAESGRVVLNPMTLNPGQSVSTFVLLSRSNGQVDVNAQMENVELGVLRPHREVFNDRR